MQPEQWEAAVSSCRPMVAKTQLLSHTELGSCAWVASISHSTKDSEQWESAWSMHCSFQEKAALKGDENSRIISVPTSISQLVGQPETKICLDLCCLKTSDITIENIKWDSSHRIYKLTAVWLLQEHVEKVIIVWQASSLKKSNSFT